MITDEQAESAVHYIAKVAPDYAKAKANRVQLEQFRQSKKSLLMRQAEIDGCKTAAIQEREAYASKEYIKLLSGLREATEQEEKLRWEMTAAQARIDVWRTQQASNRRGNI